MKQSPVLYNINTFAAKGHVLSSCRSVPVTRVTLNTLVHLLRNIPEHTLTKLSFLVMIDVPKRDIGAKIPGHFGERECVGYCFIQLVDGIVLSCR